MKILNTDEVISEIISEVIPKSAEPLSFNEALSTGSDVYALINKIIFEKSFSRLQDNYLIPLKPISLDASTHHQ